MPQEHTVKPKKKRSMRAVLREVKKRMMNLEDVGDTIIIRKGGQDDMHVSTKASLHHRRIEYE